MTLIGSSDVIDHRRRKVRLATRAYRRRRRQGIQVLPIHVTRAQLAALAKRGYGEGEGASKADKAEALETFLMDFAV
jgi:hypothetical protein